MLADERTESTKSVVGASVLTTFALSKEGEESEEAAAQSVVFKALSCTVSFC